MRSASATMSSLSIIVLPVMPDVVFSPYVFIQWVR